MFKDVVVRGAGSGVVRSCLLVSLVLSSPLARAQDVEAGRRVFAGRCANCHGTQGAGGELGPSIVGRVPLRNDQELEAVIREGVPGSGMPAFPGLSRAETHGSRRVSADAASAFERRTSSSQRDDVGRTDSRRHCAQSEPRRAAAPRRRPRRAPAPRDHPGAVPRGDVAVRVAGLQRTTRAEIDTARLRASPPPTWAASLRNGCSRCQMPPSCR